MLEFIDKIVIPFLNVAVRRRRLPRRDARDDDRVGDGPAPVRADPAVRRASSSRTRASSSRSPAARGTSGSSVIVATLGNTLGSLIAYAIGAWGGRPFLERYGKYLLIRPHEIELAERFFEKYGAATAFFSRLLPIVRTFISFPAGVARMPIWQVRHLLDGRRVPLVDPARLRRHGRWARTGRTSATRSSRSTWRSRSWSVLGAVAFIWWRLGMPGRRRPSTP